jgi:autocrine motility factor receptor
MNIAAYTSVSVLATAISLGTVYSSSNHDLPETLKNIFKSRIHILIVVNMAYNLLFLFGKLVQKVFFGNLRDAEIQNLSDRLLTYVLFKIVFVGAVMEPDLKNLLIWTSWFSILGFLKIFTLLTRDRFEYLNTFSPHTHPTIHVRMLSLLVIILFSDLAWFAVCVALFFEAGLSVLLLLNFECFTVFLDTVQTCVKYAIHLHDLARPPERGVWEQRGQYIYYTEFATDSLVLAGTLFHYIHILYLHGLSVTLLDAVLFMHMRIVFNNLRVKLIAYRNYRQLAENMNHRYPSVSPEDLQQYNDDCAICREVMVSAKKLPCGHIFHHSCLRSWLEQHHSCPTCRHSLIEQPQQPQQQQQQQQGAQNMFPNHPFANYPGAPRGDQLPPTLAGPHMHPPGANQNPNQNHSLLRFSNDRWFAWLPSFSVEVLTLFCFI